MGYRIHEYSLESDAFLRPILAGLRSNRTPMIFTYEIPNIKRARKIQWGCGIRPEMVRDADNPRYWVNSSYCSIYLHLKNPKQPQVLDDAEYDDIDCNVSRFLLRLFSSGRVGSGRVGPGSGSDVVGPGRVRVGILAVGSGSG
ncbi:unnamed protein product [Didymodactylos carnosus]|uniref:Uncharacterized protein n=1 Tax=Didymodactylos carnosus TaxID=1234261 RepID=A0A815D0G4_9BILA|nr:unnamed protein product [Didymodactylos carnosus]CAF4097850.1 unnamed protein product [Didymodactylos carnosus]